MSTQPIDYAGLAKQAGAINSSPATSRIDYAALAKQAGAINSTPAPIPSSNPDLSSALESITRMNTGQKMATPEQEAEFQKGKTSGQIAGTASTVALPAVMSAPTWAPAVAPIAAKYGIKALEGAGIGLGYQLYHELKKIFEAK